MGAVAPTPWVSAGAARALVGQTVSVATASKAADAAMEGAKPMTQNAYKVQIARTVVKRAILKAAGLDPLTA
jgi:xanthine dehydrogenase YagS FAD-binding subunit